MKFYAIRTKEVQMNSEFLCKKYKWSLYLIFKFKALTFKLLGSLTYNDLITTF